MGSIGLEANLQRIAIQAVASSPELRQLIRLSVLNTGPDSLGLNQRGHWSIDFAAQVAGIPYTTIRPSIFSASMLAAAPEIRATRTWTGLAATGRMALIDHRDMADAAVRVLGDPSTWGQHHDMTGPRLVSWPEALEVLSVELGETVAFRTADSGFELVRRLTGPAWRQARRSCSLPASGRSWLARTSAPRTRCVNSPAMSPVRSRTSCMRTASRSADEGLGQAGGRRCRALNFAAILLVGAGPLMLSAALGCREHSGPGQDPR
jgi:hypothetical protein